MSQCRFQLLQSEIQHQFRTHMFTDLIHHINSLGFNFQDISLLIKRSVVDWNSRRNKIVIFSYPAWFLDVQRRCLIYFLKVRVVNDGLSIRIFQEYFLCIVFTSMVSSTTCDIHWWTIVMGMIDQDLSNSLLCICPIKLSAHYQHAYCRDNARQITWNRKACRSAFQSFPHSKLLITGNVVIWSCPSALAELAITHVCWAVRTSRRRIFSGFVSSTIKWASWRKSKPSDASEKQRKR